MEPPPHVRRAYALAALVTLLAAVVTVGYLLVSQVVTLLVGTGALVGAVACGWMALINRGARRALLLATGLVLLLATIALLGTTGLSVIGLVFGLALLSAIAARAAIGRHRPPDPDYVKPTAVGRATRPVLVVNPQSGAGPEFSAKVARRAARQGITVVVLQPDDDLGEVAERAVRAGATALGMAGGDGSQAVVADVARRHDIGFVCVPAGTRNHFAQDLGLDRSDAIGALAAFGKAVERRVDLASVNGRVFVNNASMGVYAMIVQADEYRAAKLTTAAALLPDLVGDGPFDLAFTGPEGQEFTGADLLLVSNNPYAVRTTAALAGRPRLDVGELGVLAVRARSAEGSTSALLSWSAGELRVSSQEPVALGIDGEAETVAPPLEFKALPKSLRIRLPRETVAPGAVGRAPGLVQTVAALLRVVAGRPTWV